MTHDLKTIMQTAHRILNDRRGYCDMSAALRMSWAIAKGFPFGFELTLDNGERVVVGAMSRTEASDKLRDMQWSLVRSGRKYLGSVEFNLKLYTSAFEDIATPVAVAAPALDRAA